MPVECDGNNAAGLVKTLMRMDMVALKEGEMLDIPPGNPPREHPGDLKLIIILIGLCLAVFIVVFDNAIITTTHVWFQAIKGASASESSIRILPFILS